jgi:hypothetical protein
MRLKVCSKLHLLTTASVMNINDCLNCMVHVSDTMVKYERNIHSGAGFEQSPSMLHANLEALVGTQNPCTRESHIIHETPPSHVLADFKQREVRGLSLAAAQKPCPWSEEPLSHIW